MIKTKINWIDNDNICIVKVTDTATNKTYIGTANFNPNDDEKYKKRAIGEEIATARAKIDMLKDIRDNEIKPKIMVLNHIYTNMTTSTHFNSKSYEAKTIRRQLNILRHDLAAVRELIESLRAYTEEVPLYHMQAKDFFDAKHQFEEDGQD